MTLTIEHLNILRRPFRRAEHEFINDYVYITEEAITTRLEDADPGWLFEILNISTSADQVVVTARMTVNGVFRDGVGMQKIVMGQKGVVGEAEKGAATDALKRCARLFGVGRYLLDAPKQGAEFDKWLREKQEEAGLVPKPQQQPTKPATNITPMVDPLLNTGKELGATVTPQQKANADFNALATEGWHKALNIQPRTDKKNSTFYTLECEGGFKVSYFGQSELTNAGIDLTKYTQHNRVYDIQALNLYITYTEKGDYRNLDQAKVVAA